MKKHILKIKFEYAVDILKNGKNFEARLNDRNYEKGDLVKFDVIDCFGTKMGMDMPIYKITYVLYGGQYGIAEGYCVFGIEEQLKEK